MPEIKNLTDKNGNVVYPKTSADAVDVNGDSLSTFTNEIISSRGTNSTLNERLDNIDEIQVQTNTQLSKVANLPQDDLQKTFDKFNLINLSNETYVITEPLIIRRGKSIKGNHAKIIADFENWKGNDYTALKVEIDDGATSPEYVIEHMDRVIQDLIIIGQGNNGIISTGIKFSTSVSISTAGAVNHSFSGTMKDVIIRRFDTAIDIQASWQTVFQNIKCLECRRGIIVNGKVVNNRFIGCDVTNCSKNYTSSSEPTYGIIVKPNASLYTEGDGNPEGNMFYGCTIFQNDYNITVEKAYFTTFTDCVIDGCQYQSITLNAPNEINFNSCYIAQFKKGLGRMIEYAFPADQIYPSRVSFRDCTLQGMDTDENRGDCFVITTDCIESFVRFNVVGCNILGFNRVFNISGKLMFYNSTITGNKCYNIHTSFLGNFGGGGGRTLFDNNRVHDNVPFFELPVSFPDPHLHIGRNYCGEGNATFYIGRVTVPENSSEILLPNGLSPLRNDGCLYANDVHFYHSRPQVRYDVINNYQGSNGLIAFSEPTKEECDVIYYVSMIILK